MKVRPERPEDFPEIYKLVETAFKTAKVCDGDEQDFVDTLRARGGYIPELALVAEKDGALVGHIMMTKVMFAYENGGQTDVLLVAPLSVLLEYRSQGIGAQLMTECLDRARGLGYTCAFLAGDTQYYTRFGFRPTVDFGIRNSGEIPDEYALATEIVPGALNDMRGVVEIY